MTNGQEQYNEFAYYYDRLMRDIDYKGWCDYIISVLRQNGVEYLDVLEMACGTGNISIRMAERGYRVTAFDISEDMLMVASKKSVDLGAGVRFLRQDMRNIDICNKFGIVLCLCDSINYITEPEDLQSTFRWVYDHLKHKGIFIFDINSYYKLKNIIGSNTFTYDDGDIAYIWDNFPDGDRVEFSLTFFVKQGSMYKRFDELHVEKAYETEEIVCSLKHAGFSNIQLFDGYTFDRVYDTSERISFIAVKED